jgi:sulfate transport system ATP-binding protein
VHAALLGALAVDWVGRVAPAHGGHGFFLAGDDPEKHIAAHGGGQHGADMDKRREAGQALATGTIEHIHSVGPIVRVELRRQGSGELIDAALTRDDYQQLRLALGDTVYVRPRKLAVFLDEGANI